MTHEFINGDKVSLPCSINDKVWYLYGNIYKGKLNFRVVEATVTGISPLITKTGVRMDIILSFISENGEKCSARAAWGHRVFKTEKEAVERRNKQMAIT